MTEKEIKMHKFYMNIAMLTSDLSYASRSKVGAVIVKDNNIISFGYNGSPSGHPNICEDFENKTLPSIIHAEINCIAKAARQGISTQGSTLYVTLSPCYDCSKLLIQSGISKIIFLEEYRIKDALNFLEQSNIDIIKFSDIA